MVVTGIQYVHASPFVTRATVANELSISLGTVDNRIKEIKNEIKNGRYGDFAIINSGGLVLINYFVLIDYLFYRQRLREKNLRKNVPDYDPKKIANEIGWYTPVKKEGE